MTGSIICGIDDSESAKGAARVARELSAQLGTKLVFVHVVDGGSADTATARLQELAESASDVDGSAHWLVDVGHPADRLVAVAEEEGASLIVVGSTGPHSSLLGSISADVSRRAPCPVVVVVAPGAHHSVVNGTRDARMRRQINGARPGDDPNPGDFPGGIVRFSLGGTG
jgi:nucleotide-binding universal stress UspA family protein